MPSAPWSWKALAVPKRGHAADEYEDAWAADGAAGRFAIADGASESAYAAPWARLLTEEFAAAGGPPGNANWLAQPRRRWATAVDGTKLPWYGEAKREQGAFAAFLGLALGPAADSGGPWTAMAVGDCCLFQVRDGALIHAFPLTGSAEFSNQPPLLCSRAGPAPVPRWSAGEWRTGDRFLLMTDALAQWFLSVHEARREPWDEVEAPQGEKAFTAFVEQCRDRRVLRNDDVTIMVVHLSPGRSD